MKTILLLTLMQSIFSGFPLWDNCKKWVEEKYETFFANKPKTPEERREWANSVYKKAILNNDSLQLAEAYYLFGKIEFILKQDYLKTKYWFLKSLAIQEMLGPSKELSRVNLWLAFNEDSHKNYHQTLNYFKQAAHVAEIINDEKAKGDVYVVLSEFYSPQIFTNPINDYTNIDSAKIYATKAKKSAQKSKDTNVLTLLSIRESTLDSTNSSTALEEAVKKMPTGMDQGTYRVTSLLKLTQLYLNQGKLDIAAEKLQEAKEAFSILSQFPNLEKWIKSTEINLLAKEEKFQEAYLLLQNVRNEETESWRKEKLKVIHNMEDQLHKLINENQETELTLHRENLLLQRKFLWAFALLICITAVTALLFFILNRKNKQISTQNALLVKEQNHRFNNNLQTISSLLTLKSTELTSNDAENVFNESKLLIQAISSLQRKLYSSDKLTSVELHKLLPELVNAALTAFNMNHVKVNYNLLPLEIPANEALNLNLIFTELTINACKYAFKEHPSPSLSINVEKKEGYTHFVFADNGTKEIDLSTESFGMFLIRNLVKQMQGSFEFFYNNGTHFEMKCKLKPL